MKEWKLKIGYSFKRLYVPIGLAGFILGVHAEDRFLVLISLFLILLSAVVFKYYEVEEEN